MIDSIVVCIDFYHIIPNCKMYEQQLSIPPGWWMLIVLSNLIGKESIIVAIFIPVKLDSSQVERFYLAGI